MQRISKFFRQYRSIVIPAAVVLAIVIVVLVAYAAGQHKTNSNQSKQAAAVTSNSDAVTPAQTTQPAQPTPPAIAGYGALQEDWNNNHQQDPNYATNEVYDPTPGIGTDSSHTDRYYALSTSSGRVTEYEMRLPNDQNLAAAQAEVMKEFPSDASILWQQTQGECSQMEVQSVTLGTALGNPSVAGGSQGQVFVEFQTDTATTENQFSYYNPSNVNLATLSQASYNNAAGAPSC
jgi:hypothetical protein